VEAREMAADAKLSCLISGLENEVYHASPGLSKSDLDRIARSPAHYVAAKQEVASPTPAMRFGTAVHVAVLEPELFRGTYAMAPVVDRRTKAGKEAWEEFQASGKQPLTSDEWAAIAGMRDSVMALPAVTRILSGGEAEMSLFHYLDDLGVRAKIRPDWANSDIATLFDLKTTRDASPDQFAKSCATFRYHVQAAFYSDVWRMRTGQPVRAFVFCAVEKEPPYAAALYVLDDEAIQAGRRSYRYDLETYATCREADEWPAYSTDVETLSLPAWALR